MEENRIWQVLGIEPTKDENAIRNAYRQQLVHTHPEDDPEGFKALRTSYEEAILWAQQEESEQEGGQETPIDIWIKQVEACYDSFYKRCDKEVWHKLLQDTLCQDLETSDMASEKLLVFLMDHYYLPKYIWEMIDHTFCILELQETLKEKFPPNFIDFLVRQINSDNLLAYEDFRGADDADYDAFINQYFDIKALLDERKLEEVKEPIENIQMLNITHPILKVELMRYKLYIGHKEEALQLAQSFEIEQQENPYMLYFIGNVYWENEVIEAAGKAWQRIMAIAPKYYWAHIEMTKYYLKVGQYKEAKDLALDVLDEIGHQEELEAYMREANAKLLEAYEKEWQSEGSQHEESVRYEMAWCYFQNEDFASCEQILTYTPTTEYTFEYTNLKGRNYLASEQYEKAIPYLLKWLDAINALMDDGTEKTRRRLKRKTYAYYTIGSCYQHLNQYDKAIAYLKEGIKSPSEDKQGVTILKETLASVYLDIKENEKCVDLCNEIIEDEPNYFPAYVRRQRAHYNLREGQQVIDDFYAMKEVFAGYAVSYALAMEVFLAYRQYEDVLSIYKQAEENGVKSLGIDFNYQKYLKEQCESVDDLNEVIKALETILEKAEQEANDLEDISEVAAEITQSYMRLNNYDEALKYANKALKLNDSKPRYSWMKADILVGLARYQEAYELYNKLEEDYADNANLYIDRGECLEHLGYNKKAINDYLKALELDETQRTANQHLADIYLRVYESSEEMEYYDLAVKHAKQQVAITKEAYYYIELGLVYLEGYELEEAEVAFKKAIELNPKDLYAYNNLGFTYKLLGRYEEAISLYQKAVGLMSGNETILPHANLATCYLILGRYDEAELIAKKNIELFPDERRCYELLAEIYGRARRYNDQITLYKQLVHRFPTKKATYMMEIGDAYCSLKKRIMTEFYYNKAVHKDAKELTSEYIKACSSYAGYLADDLRNYRGASTFYKRALDHIEVDTQEYINTCMELVKVYSLLNNQVEARLYFDKMMGAITKLYGSIEKYLTYPSYAMARCYNLGYAHFYMGDVKKAAYYFNEMTKKRMCRKCHYKACYEALLGQAMLYEAAGDKVMAYQYYEKVQAIHPDLGIVIHKLKELKK